ATAAVVMGDEKLTVAVTPVNNESKVEHVRRLLSKKVKILLLDSGYYTVDVINYLNANGKFKDGDNLQNEQQEKKAK
ncbi:MAG: hypothetical protein RXP28_08290, partial [Nitrososphaeria archaeon]